MTYQISNDAAGSKTEALRCAWIDSQVYGFGAAIKAFGMDRFKKNCAKTVSVIHI